MITHAISKKLTKHIIQNKTPKTAQINEFLC